jgi:hypothetical protein
MESLEPRQHMITGWDGLDPGFLDDLVGDVPAFPAQEAPRSLGAFAGAKVRKVLDSIDTSDAVDLFKISVTSKMRLYVDLRGMTKDADLVLYDGNGSFVEASGNFGNANERIAKTVRRGTYYAAVFAYDGKTNYTLRIETKLPAPAKA